jgi:two-component system CheB/CheR fusion protein
MAEELLKLRSHPYLTAAPQARERENPLEEQSDYSRILSLLKASHSVDFSQYKPSTISRRIGRRMLLHHITSLSEYLKFLEQNPLELDNLYRDILICVTSFFREPAMFEALRNVVNESLASRKPTEPFRIWVAGCATGEEAYSYAIALRETIEAAGRDIPIQIFGTDISDTAIDRARNGLFSENIQQEMSPERLRRFFTRVDSGYKIVENIRQSCIFARHDLTADPPFSHMDLISCRNVLIYLGPAIQERILPTLHYGLKQGGILVLGTAETIGARSDLYATLDKEWKIFGKKAVPSKLGIELPPSDAVSRSFADVHSQLSPQIPAFVDIEARTSRILRDLYAPPGVVINEDMQVLHFHGQTSFYLEQSQGEASLNLLSLVRESLLFPLRGAVERAMEKKEPVHETGIRVEHNGQMREITLRVIPVSEGVSSYLILFEEQQRASSEDTEAVVAKLSQGIPEPGTLELQLSHSQREIAQMRDYLRKVTEQHGAATEELRAANEEARSSNEELQSTNEELRTAKEELQSSNEELTTVNDELKHRNEELRLASNDLSNILTAAMIPIFIVGIDLRLRRFTPSAERLLNLHASDIGQKITDVQYSFIVPNLKDMLVSASETLEVRHERLQDRHGRWYEVFVRPYRTVDNRIEGAVVSFIDIDDLTKALADAERARDFAEGIVETVQHPLLILDPDYRILRATEAFFKTFQEKPGETIGQLLGEIGTGQWKFPELQRLLDSALVRDVPFRDLDIEHDFPHIGRRTMRLNARRITSRDHQPHRLLLAIEDVTERKEKAEIQYRRLFESARDAILIVDASSGEVVDMNPYFNELTRYQRGQVVGKRFWDLDVFHKSEEAARLIPETRRERNARYDSVRVRARDGAELILEIISNPYRVRDSEFIQVNIRDVTERRRMEERLRRSNLDLQQFAFAASHDLQEPLRTVTSFSQLLKQQHAGKLGAEADKHLDFIVSAADRMSHMVLDLLGYSQIVRAETSFSPVSAEAALASAILNLQMAIKNSDARVTFDHLPTVVMDQTQLMQLLQNLISNGIKYRSAEPPRIHLSARETASEWVFSVADNGLGIEPKYAEHIFTVFKRLHGREYPGTGIGLALCKRIIERHGGRIWVESELGKGSTFYFSVPKTPTSQI